MNISVYQFYPTWSILTLISDRFYFLWLWKKCEYLQKCQINTFFLSLDRHFRSFDYEWSRNQSGWCHKHIEVDCKVIWNIVVGEEKFLSINMCDIKSCCYWDKGCWFFIHLLLLLLLLFLVKYKKNQQPVGILITTKHILIHGVQDMDAQHGDLGNS